MLSGYRLMWMLVMFDLPVLEPAERKAATDFRKDLLGMGFDMAQLSVYLRFCTSQTQVDTLCKRVERALPPGGSVHILQFTDKQFERTIRFNDRKRQAGEKAPEQFALF